VALDKRTLVKIAHYYYKEGLTQDQIAQKLYMSRQRVNRLIKMIMEQEIVTIQINGYLDYHIDLEGELEKRYKLKQAVVITASENDGDLFEKLGIAGANYLSDIISDQTIIGVAWGRTLQKVAVHLPKSSHANAAVVQLLGGNNVNSGEVYTQSSEITRIFADRLGATPYFLHAPIFVENKEFKEALLSNASIKVSFDMIKKCNIAITSIGGVSENVTPFKHNLLATEHLTNLKDLGCVGNLCFRYYDIEGNTVETPLNSMLIGPSLQDLRSIPMIIGVGGGREKYDGILGALKGGYLDVLITNHETAQAILSKS
jgi:DNA-binding transcriptional regulator LsrR (DeoR family)